MVALEGSPLPFEEIQEGQIHLFPLKRSFRPNNLETGKSLYNPYQDGYVIGLEKGNIYRKRWFSPLNVGVFP